MRNGYAKGLVSYGGNRRIKKHRSSTIDEGVEHSNTAVACLQNIRTGIAERLTRKSASSTTRPDIVHRRPSPTWPQTPPTDRIPIETCHHCADKGLVLHFVAIYNGRR